MSDASADVSSSVEYGRNKFVLDRVPWAMWFCVGGLAAVLHTGGANGATRALVGLAMLGLGVAGLAATLLIIRWGSRINDHINGASVVGVFLALGLWGIASVVHLFENPRPLIYQQLNAFGWMAIYLGCGYIAYALFRHFYPEGPVIQLSQSGILFNRPWLRLFVPWQDIQEVGRLDDSRGFDPSGPGRRVGNQTCLRALCLNRSGRDRRGGDQHVLRARHRLQTALPCAPGLQADVPAQGGDDAGGSEQS
jgi:hypothetical protein